MSGFLITSINNALNKCISGNMPPDPNRVDSRRDEPLKKPDINQIPKRIGQDILRQAAPVEMANEYIQTYLPKEYFYLDDNDSPGINGRTMTFFNDSLKLVPKLSLGTNKISPSLEIRPSDDLTYKISATLNFRDPAQNKYTLTGPLYKEMGFGISRDGNGQSFGISFSASF